MKEYIENRIKILRSRAVSMSKTQLSDDSRYMEGYKEGRIDELLSLIKELEKEFELI